MKHTIQCRCGCLRAEVSGGGMSNRVICYCTDCQAFAKFLGRGADIMDAQGGTEIVQIAQARVHFIQGQDQLKVVRLSQSGMLRWYAACCKTPLGNTLASPKWSFIGLIHSALERRQMDSDFGAKVSQVNTASALGAPKPQQNGMLRMMLRFLWIVASNRLSGRYIRSPFFDAAGTPIAQVQVLSLDELAAIKQLA